MVALRLLGFSGDFSVATNPWHLDIEMIMVALRLLGFSGDFFRGNKPLAPRHWNDHGSVKTPRVFLVIFPWQQTLGT